MSLLLGSAASSVAPLIPGVPVFGSGTRQIFTSSGTFVSNGQAVRVYVVAGAGGAGTQSSGGGGGFATAIVTPPSGNINVVIGAKGAANTAGGSSSFGTSTYLVSASGGSGGADTGSEVVGGVGTVGTLLVAGGGSVGTPAIDRKPKYSGVPNFPYGISGSDVTSGAGVVIVEY